MRITPAYAGKSGQDRIRQADPQDHPRVCGEKYLMVMLLAAVAGSPPRMRGKDRATVALANPPRITPAYAGKRCPASRAGPVFGDHPRVCGEKTKLPRKEKQGSGSPPRMRGKEPAPLWMLGTERITPAYAGKRLKRSRSTVPPAAIVPLFPSVCNKPVVSDGSPAGRDAPLFLPAENAVPASPAYNLRSL